MATPAASRRQAGQQHRANGSPAAPAVLVRANSAASKGSGRETRSVVPVRSARELLEEFRLTGSEPLFEEVVRRYAGMVYGVCLRVTKDSHDAEDAAQAVFLTLALHVKAHKEIKYLGPWLQQVGKRLSLDMRRGKKRRTRREQKVASRNGHTARGDHTAALDFDELKPLVMEELNKLPPRYRLPLVMHFYGGLSREEMARELGCKPSTLGVRIHRGREMLSTRLARRGITLGAVALATIGAAAVQNAMADSVVAATCRAASDIAFGGRVAYAAGVPAHVLSAASGRAAITGAVMAKIKAIGAAVAIAAASVAAAGEVARHIVPSNWNFPRFDVSSLVRPLLQSVLPRLEASAKPQPDAAPTGAPQLATTDASADRSAPSIVATTADVNFTATASSDPIISHSAAETIARQSAQRIVPHRHGGARGQEATTDSKPAGDILVNAMAVEPQSDRSEELSPIPPINSKPPGLAALVVGSGPASGEPAIARFAVVDEKLAVAMLSIGDASAGEFAQSGGEIEVVGDLVVGKKRSGKYTLDGPGKISSDNAYVGLEGEGTFEQSDGLNEVQNDLYIGFNNAGRYRLSGEGKVSAGTVHIGVNDRGEFYQVGRDTVVDVDDTVASSNAPAPTSTTRPAAISSMSVAIAQATSTAGPTTRSSVSTGSDGAVFQVAESADSSGEYTLGSGKLAARNQVIGVDGMGTLIQGGGTNIATSVILGAEIGSKGTYALRGGTLHLADAANAEANSKRGLVVGDAGSGLLEITGGTISQFALSSGMPLTVRRQASGSGTIQGWGMINLSGLLDNNGRIVASGGGRDRDLYFSSFSGVSNSIDNALGKTSGWFVTEGGRLVLPPLSVRRGISSVTWGESPADRMIDLINSVRVTFHDVKNPGSLRMALVSQDRAEVPDAPAGHRLLNIWSVNEDVSFTAAHLTVRYDDVLANAANFNETTLKLWLFRPEVGWQVIEPPDLMRDPAANLLHGTLRDGTTFIAVGR